MDENDLRKQQANEAIQAIQYHAACIHALLEPGMTIDIMIQNDSAIVIPNAPREMGRLIITRPRAILKIAPK